MLRNKSQGDEGDGVIAASGCWDHTQSSHMRCLGAAEGMLSSLKDNRQGWLFDVYLKSIVFQLLSWLRVILQLIYLLKSA